MEKALHSYISYRKKVLNRKGAEKDAFWDSVYRIIGKQYRARGGAPFPTGINRQLLRKYLVTVRGQTGGVFSPGTIPQLLEKIARAYEEALYNDYMSYRRKYGSKGPGEAEGEPPTQEGD